MAVELKDSAAYASTADLPTTKAEPQTLEGTAALSFDEGKTSPGLGTRLLLTAQADAEDNGLWGVTSNESFGGSGTFGGSGNFGEGAGWALKRPVDADTDAEINHGMMVPVSAGPFYVLTTHDPIEVGTTPQTFLPITANPVGPAGGHLAGTYADPSVIAGGTNNFS